MNKINTIEKYTLDLYHGLSEEIWDDICVSKGEGRETRRLF